MNPSISDAQMVGQLDKVSQAHMSEIVSYANDNLKRSDKEMGSNSHIFDTFYDDGGSTPIKSMCNFTVPDFDEFWMMLTDHVGKFWNVD